MFTNNKYALGMLLLITIILFGCAGEEPWPEEVVMPGISINEPLHNAEVSGDNILISAEVEGKGSIRRLEFRLGVVPIAEFSGAPYNFTWDSTKVADGKYELLAIAMNDQGIVTSTTPVTIIVRNFAEEINLAHEELRGTEYIIRASSLSENSKVANISLYLDGRLAKTCPGPECELKVSARPGEEIKYHAVIQDESGLNKIVLPENGYNTVKVPEQDFLGLSDSSSTISQSSRGRSDSGSNPGNNPGTPPGQEDEEREDGGTGDDGDEGNDEIVGEENVVSNPSFEEGKVHWTFYTNGEGEFSVESVAGRDSAAKIAVEKKGSNKQLYQQNIELRQGEEYVLRFDAFSPGMESLDVSVLKHTSPFTNYGLMNHEFRLSDEWETHEAKFTVPSLGGSTLSDARLMFWLAPYAEQGDEIWIDNVYIFQVNGSGRKPSDDPSPNPPVECVNPEDNKVYSEDTVFCSGTFNLPSGIRTGSDGITITCQSTELVGNNQGTGISVEGHNNVKVQGCFIQNYGRGIEAKWGADRFTAYDNTFDLVDNGVYFLEASNGLASHNTFLRSGHSGTTHAIISWEKSHGNTFEYNTVEGNNGWTYGVRIRGKDTLVQHNDITLQFNDRDIAVALDNNKVTGTRILYNRLVNCGRKCLQLHGDGTITAHNHLENANHTYLDMAYTVSGNDPGTTYTYNQVAYNNTIIRTSPGWQGTGIYVRQTANANISNNYVSGMMGSGISLEYYSATHNNYVFNNTVTSTTRTASGMGGQCINTFGVGNTWRENKVSLCETYDFRVAGTSSLANTDTFINNVNPTSSTLTYYIHGGGADIGLISTAQPAILRVSNADSASKVARILAVPGYTYDISIYQGSNIALNQQSYNLGMSRNTVYLVKTN